jgi:uncharacterized membrane protein
MIVFRRDLVVQAPVERAWHHFNDAAAWPSWHTDVTKVDVTPPGPLGPTSTATLHMIKGPRVTFRMTEFVPYEHWVWISNMLWLTLRYDHRFERVDDRTTRITLQLELDGVGQSLVGRMIGGTVSRSLDKDLPLLAAEMASGTPRCGA